MTRPPLFMCFSAACVVARTPRRLMLITRSISSCVASSNGFGMAVPALFTSTSSRPKVVTVLSTALLTASTSAASAWIARAFPPLRSIALTTAEAALTSFAYVMATLAPSLASLFAIAAPMPREPPVTSATFSDNVDMSSPMVSYVRFSASLVQSSAMLMCLHCKQIWHDEEYRLFRIGIRGGREEACFAHGLEVDNKRENRYSLHRIYSIRGMEVRVDKFDAMQMFVRLGLRPPEIVL